MKLLHTKSPCCGAKIQRFGSRRRKCAICGHTWRIRIKKRGRKRKRVRPDIICRYLEKKSPPLRIAASRRGCGKDVIQAELHHSLIRYIEKHHDDWRRALIGSKNLIAVADAIWYRVCGKRHTIYVILLRPQNSTRAVICPPLIISEHECAEGWQKAFENLPPALKNRIVALICDGGTGLIAAARSYDWIIQRCHFHLLMAVQNYLTTGPRSAHRKHALTVMAIVQDFLRTNDKLKLQRILNDIKKIFAYSTSRGLRRVLAGLLTNYVDYHTYLNFPRLQLPTTSNSAESFIQCIRDLMYRCRGFRSLSSLDNWLRVLAIFKKTISCNGKNQPN